MTAGDTTLTIFFVADESEHIAFFRSVVALENAGEAEFQRLARSAFPALDWADNIWRGLRHFDRPYIEVRDELVRCLGGLSDHGANKVFWWHVKQRPDVDRVHFLYEPSQAGSTELGKGRIVVGLFTDHCILPS